MAPGRIENISTDSADGREFPSPYKSRETRILEKMLNKLRRYPQYWDGDPFDLRDTKLLYGTSADFMDYRSNMGTCYISGIFHFKPGEHDTPKEITPWTTENDSLCKLMVSRCGGKANGFPKLGEVNYPTNLEIYHIKVNVKITLPNIIAARYQVSWGNVSTSPDKIQIYDGPNAFTPRHHWDAMIMHDCTVTNDGDMRKSAEIATRKWDVLLMRMGLDYNFPWLPVSMRDAGPLTEEPPRECFPCVASIRTHQRGMNPPKRVP